MNKALIVGRIGNINDKGTFMSASIATNEYTKINGKFEQSTSWHNIVLFAKTAENFKKIVNKGDLVEIDGSITYFEKDGKKYTNIRVGSFRLLQKNTKNESSKNEATVNEATVTDTNPSDNPNISDTPF